LCSLSLEAFGCSGIGGVFIAVTPAAAGGRSSRLEEQVCSRVLSRRVVVCGSQLSGD
jgi:hypothetical protein